MIYYRQNDQTVPIRYIDSESIGALVVSQKHSLALITHGMGSRGPTGPAGEPYLWDTTIASASPEYTPLIVDLVTPATHFRAPFPITAQYIRVSLSIAPTGSPVIIDVHMNGTSMLSTLIQIDIGMKTSVGSAIPAVLSIVNITDDAEFTVFIVQRGSAISGSGVKVAITGKKVQPI
jgi:hypothetical protein